MAEPLPEFHLGILGGCMSHQRGTPINSLYHRQLAVLLQADPRVRLRPHIVRDFTLDHVSRLERLLDESRVDGVMVHIREVTIVAAARAFVSVRWEGGRRRRLNAAMFNRRHRSGAERPASSGASLPGDVSRSPDAYGGSDDDLQDLPLPGRRIAGFRLRNLNYMLGVITGLGGWAIQEELLRFDDLARACRERGLPLFVLGPTPATYSYWANLITKRANVLIRRHLSGMDVPCVLVEWAIDGNGRSLVRADGFHMNVDGHRFIAERLYEGGMRDWVAKIVDVRRGGGASRPTGPVLLKRA